MSAGNVSIHRFILGLLDQQPRSGYDIKRLLKGLDWLIDGPSFGNIYTTLHGLFAEGLVTVELVHQENKPPRKVYSLTDAGREALQEWANEPLSAPHSMKTFLMQLILAGSFSYERLVRHMQQRHAQVAARRAALATHCEGLEGQEDGQRLALEYSLAMADTELRWLDSALQRLSRQPVSLDVVEGK